MSKHNMLTEEEFNSHKINSEVTRILNDYQQNRNITNNNLNLLDWGCGRGRDVLSFREKGYNSYGVDIDHTPVDNAKEIFARRGYKHTDLLFVIKHEDYKTPFEDNFFDFTTSRQVFEHVSDMEKVAKELKRITKPGGCGIHIFPAHKYIREGHLHMPFVHWFPKNIVRKYVILFYLYIGISPRWKELEKKSKFEQANVYYLYSINKTFYRTYEQIKEIFNQAGFEVTFETINNYRIVKVPILKKFRKVKYIKFILNYFLLNFKSIELKIYSPT